MNELSYLKAVILGIIQGITEFLPISSSAHLALGERWLNLKPDDTTIFFFLLATHLGTLVAVVIVFAVPLKRYLLRLVRESGAAWGSRPRYAWRIALLGLIATVPTGVIGLAFKSELEASFNRPRQIGAELVITGVLLAATGKVRRGRRRWKDFRWWHAGLVGVAQGLAILPGISRSGATICTAELCGLRRQWAAQFSFLIAFPAIIGAALFEFRDLLQLPDAEFQQTPWGPIVAGTAVALATGVISLALLVQAVRRAKLHYFAWYCWGLGLLAVLGIL